MISKISLSGILLNVGRLNKNRKLRNVEARIPYAQLTKVHFVRSDILGIFF